MRFMLEPWSGRQQEGIVDDHLGPSGAGKRIAAIAIAVRGAINSGVALSVPPGLWGCLGMTSADLVLAESSDHRGYCGGVGRIIFDLLFNADILLPVADMDRGAIDTRTAPSYDYGGSRRNKLRVGQRPVVACRPREPRKNAENDDSVDLAPGSG